jgi:glycosyltransferase involved in cell wall biosynthesis
VISVCIATYNGQDFIKEQLESILSQLKDNDEIIISDDGSQDSTLDIIKNINDKRIKVFKNINKKGVIGNYQNALENAYGDYIFLSDQDDVWLPNKVDVSLNGLKNNDIVVTDCHITDQNLRIEYQSYFQVFNSQKGFLKNLYRSSYLGCCLAFRKSVLEGILPFPSNLLMYHDWWFGFFAETIYTKEFIPIQCMNYRRHESATSMSIFKSHLGLKDKIYYRLQFLYLGFIRLYQIKIRKVTWKH